jgi:hypothetical protein
VSVPLFNSKEYAESENTMRRRGNTEIKLEGPPLILAR